MDYDPSTRRTLPRVEADPEQRSLRRVWIEHQGRRFELRPGAVIIGRSSNSHLVLDDGLVSRRHAQLLVSEDQVLVEDFASANGVFVNGKRIVGREPLKSGDQIQIGSQQLVLGTAAASVVPAASAARFGAETLHGLSVAPARLLDRSAEAKRLSSVPEADTTHREDALELLGGVADKVLALGRGEEAERLLATAMNHVLLAATQARELAPGVIVRAATYAGKLAEATGHGKWLDYTIELYAALRRPIPIELVDQMYAVLRRVNAVNLPALRAYISTLQAQATSYAPNERFAIQRLEGLERLVALK